MKGVGRVGEDIQVEVLYSGEIYDSLKVPSFSREFIANQTTGLIGEEGVYLGEASWWYPRRSGFLAPFSLEVTIPADYEVVSQGELEANEVAGGVRRVRWSTVYPTDVIYLIAGRYDVEQRDVDGVSIYAYFFPKSQDLKDSYLSATDRYIRMYTELIGPYPYEKFAVVENFFETGYGMPSFTLLGSSVIRLPFIVHTSLGHEVLHNWWGNSVFIDSTSGNWCESLTTYMADYYYKEQRGEESARDYRRDINKSYSNYVNTNNDFSLATFTSRTTPATRTVGYGKGAMIYHGLRRVLGDEVFFQALRNFFRDHIYDYASWDDLKYAFEKEGKIDLDWFFDQWIEGIGAPLLHLGDVQYREGSPGTIDFTISQEGSGTPYRLEIPVILATNEGKEDHLVELRSEEMKYSIESSGTPLSLSIDPDFHLFRRMDPLGWPDQPDGKGRDQNRG
jgi:aminopeptidase N